MSGGRCETRDVIVVRESGSLHERISVVRELPLTIYLNERELITLVTTGDFNRELALGFLLSEGFLKEKGELESVRVNDGEGTVEVCVTGDVSTAGRLWEKRTVTSGCGKGATFYHVLDSLHSKTMRSDMTVRPEQIRRLMSELNRMSELYRETHGVHNSALADTERILLFRDDIGRHNAVDKIRGAGFLEDIQLDDKLLVTTGRLSSEIVIKAAKMRIPILASRSAPTSLAIELAERVGMTLVGNVRGRKMNVYTGSERILF